LSTVDWNLLIGFTQTEAEEYLKEEDVAFKVILTKPPGKSLTSEEETRVIAVRNLEAIVELICASPDWTVS